MAAIASTKYKKQSHHQHILERPDTYIGSTKTNEETRWVFDAMSGKMVWRTVKFNPGLYKIFDEIIVNARDEFVRSTTTYGMTPVKHLDVTVTPTEDGQTMITVENDGDGIVIAMNDEEKMMVPEMIFGQLLTSSNYDDSEERIVGGKNGLGQKCLHPDTLVPLFNGQTCKVKELSVGAQVIGDDGTPRNVLGVQHGHGQMYRVDQTYGDSYVVNDEHILTLHMSDHESSCIVDMSIRDYMALPEAEKHRITGVRAQCVQWPHRDVSIDPYDLGVWINDNSGRYSLPEEYITSSGLLQHKFIPTDYLINDRKTRLALLDGIIDANSSVREDCICIWITDNERLMNEITYLARSLGFYSKSVPLTGVWIQKNRNTAKSMGAIHVSDAGMDKFVGIQIDGNERFVINDFTVTHNCTNIFSTYFHADLKTPQSGKQYAQTWRNNMYTCERPEIKPYKLSKGSVKVSFVPDPSRFAGAFTENGMSQDMVSVFHTRVIELAGLVGKDVKVTWNGAVVATNTFEKYIKLFLRDGLTGYAYEDCGPRWEIGAILASHLYSDEEELPEDKHLSFVNGVHTKKGGKHVETVSRKVLGDFSEWAKTKKVDIKPGQLKHSVVLFINATIVNPSFDSQSKEFMTTPAAEFGSRPEFAGKLTTSLGKLGLLEEAKFLLEAKSARESKKTDGKKRSTLRGITKLEDAMFAGTSKSRECTLILTEGDSAATSAISGLKEVGRERWGVFPLRGKLLNVRDITPQKFNANEELTAIKKILGLEQGKQYKDISELRYGRVMIMADQDHDGSHIKGLLMNLFHAEWPGLMQTGFLCTLLTPILKASRASTVFSFYSIPEFNQWKEENGGVVPQGWKIKYYKGLGTSTPAEAREWFKDLHEIQYEWDEKTNESINLAFNKKQANDRKSWLSHYDPTLMLIPVENKASYTNFVNCELIHFSNADNIRSLPHLMDGLKPSQRKILYSCFKRNLRDEIRVAQLAGYVSEHAAYHHGEASLCSTIISMAQNFVGSNNVNLLKPVGQFGSVLQGGADSASPRYIHTYLEEITRTLFRKEDNRLLNYVDDDGDLVEPEYYLPVVPLLALNGSVGIGTGYSTDIPPYNPTDIVTLIRHRIEGSLDTLADRPLDPWWFGFKGKVIRHDDQTWWTKGIYDFDDVKRTVTITELPVGMWTKDYKAFLDGLCEEEEKKSKEAKKELKKSETASQASTRSNGTSAEPSGLKGFDDLYNDVDVNFVLYFTEEGYDNIRENTTAFEKRFKLTTSWKTTNMTCFDTEFNIVKYKTVGDLLEAFVQKRLPMYEERRMHVMRDLETQMTELDAKRRFIQAILDETLVIQKRSDSEIVEGLKACSIPPLSCPEKPNAYDSYDYVLRMRIDRLKYSAIVDLDEQIAEKQSEVDHLKSQTAQSLWSSDLAEFIEAWNHYTQARLASQMVTTSSSDKNSGVQITKRRKAATAATAATASDTKEIAVKGLSRRRPASKSAQ